MPAGQGCNQAANVREQSIGDCPAGASLARLGIDQGVELLAVEADIGAVAAGARALGIPGQRDRTVPGTGTRPAPTSAGTTGLPLTSVPPE